MNDSDFSSALLEIYRWAREAPPPVIQTRALETLARKVQFDSAIWGQGWFVDAQLKVDHVFERDVDPSSSSEWRNIGGPSRDKVIAPGCAAPGKSIQYHAASLFSDDDEKDLRDYTRRHGRSRYLVTVIPMDATGRGQWLSLFRSGEDHEFTSAQVGLCEAYMPHFVEAYRISELLGVGKVDSSAANLPAQIECAADTTGRLLHPSEQFLAVLRLEWPQFGQDDLLPGHLRDAMSQAHRGKFVGRKIRMEFQRLGDLLRLSVHKASAFHALPKRRAEVARLYSEGLSHKEIARQLSISPATVRNHLQAAFSDLDVHSRSQLRALIRT